MTELFRAKPKYLIDGRYFQSLEEATKEKERLLSLKIEKIIIECYSEDDLLHELEELKERDARTVFLQARVKTLQKHYDETGKLLMNMKKRDDRLANELNEVLLKAGDTWGLWALTRMESVIKELKAVKK